jgi:hypothetical protein
MTRRAARLLSTIPLVTGILLVLSHGQVAHSAADDQQVEAFHQLQAKNFSKALECFTAASQDKPNSWQILESIGNCHSELGHYDVAISYFLRSIEVGGYHSSQCLNIARAYQKLGDNGRAMLWLKQASLLDPAVASDPGIQATLMQLRDPANYPVGSPDAKDYLSGLESFKGWAKEEMPIKVYVRRNYQIPSFYPQFVEIVHDSLNQWCAASGNTITYKLIDNRELADLICDYTDRRELVSSQHELGIDGNTEMLVKQDNAPGKANMVILVKDSPSSSTFRTRPLLTLCCLHETGHALGMHGHSPNSHDVMFSCATLTDKAVLSERDKATMKRIYQKTDVPKSSPASNVRTKQAEDWQKWHQSLDEVIKRKFAETCAQGNLRADPPLVCEVKYDISRIGQILNIELSKKTNSRICNIAAETVIRSLEKDPILNFPDGATESTIRKCSTFSYSPKRENLY